jgi:hypothetical protein
MNKLNVGDSVVFNQMFIEQFIEETSGKSNELDKYRQIVMGGIEQIGIIKEIDLENNMITVSYPDGWNVPIFKKYLRLAE